MSQLPKTADSLGVALDALRGNADVAAWTTSARIVDAGSPVPAGVKALRVSVVDDAEDLEPYRSVARVSVECWGAGAQPEDALAAYDGARTVRAASRDLIGVYGSGTILQASTILMTPAPDEETGRARFLVDLSLTVA